MKKTQCTKERGRTLPGIRIARVSTVPFFVVSQLRRQIESLSQSGAETFVVTSKGPELETLESMRGVTCVPVEIARSINVRRDLVALFRLFLFFKRERFDIAHSTTPKAGLLTAIAAFMAGVPIRLHTFTGQPWVNLKGPLRWLARWSDWLIGQLNTRCYADSESQRQFLLDQRIMSAGRLFVIGAGSLAGVDLNRFNPARFSSQEKMATREKLAIPESAPVLLFVGRITRDKGIRELVEAFSGLKGCGSPAHLVLVGPFDEEKEGLGLSKSETNKVQDVHFVGYTDSPETYLAIADILCLPSYREGFGTVIIEAAAMGVPAVGTNIYGLSDAVENGKTGILVPPHDHTSLREALAHLLGNDELRWQMGRAAGERAKELFDADQVNKQVIREYCALLDEKRRK